MSYHTHTYHIQEAYCGVEIFIDLVNDYTKVTNHNCKLKNIFSSILTYTCPVINHLANMSLSFIMTTSNGNIFRVTGLLCGEFTGHRWIPCTKGTRQNFDAEALMFSLIHALNKRLNKHWWGWWFETPSRPLWRHYNVNGLVRNWPTTCCVETLYIWYCLLMFFATDSIMMNQNSGRALFCIKYWKPMK